jgi:hypothetical protein
MLTFDSGERGGGLKAALIKLDDVLVLLVSRVPISTRAMDLGQLQSGVEVFRVNPQNLPANSRAFIDPPVGQICLRKEKPDVLVIRREVESAMKILDGGGISLLSELSLAGFDQLRALIRRTYQI